MPATKSAKSSVKSPTPASATKSAKATAAKPAAVKPTAKAAPAAPAKAVKTIAAAPPTTKAATKKVSSVSDKEAESSGKQRMTKAELQAAADALLNASAPKKRATKKADADAGDAPAKPKAAAKPRL